MTKRQRFIQYMDECSNLAHLDYLTVVCSTRSKQIANKCKRLLQQGKYGEALKVGDPIAFEVGLNEFR